MIDRWFVIINPKAGSRKFPNKWNKIKKLFEKYHISYDFTMTEFSKHEIHLVQLAIKNGYQKFIVIGGDGTLHHTVNGIMKQEEVPTSRIKVGIIPIGTGNDWIKTYNIPKNIEKAIKCIAEEKSMFQDIGIITSHHNIHYFNNVAGIGYDAYVVNQVNKLKKFGSISYLLAGLYGMLFYKKSTFEIHLNQQVFKTKSLMTIFGICKYSGGGMQFTQDPLPQDGLLDITVAKDFNFIDLLVQLPNLYNGKIVHHKKVSTYKTDEIQVIPSNSNTFIQADGEILSQGKVKVSMTPKAIQFIIN